MTILKNKIGQIFFNKPLITQFTKSKIFLGFSIYNQWLNSILKTNVNKAVSPFVPFDSTKKTTSYLEKLIVLIQNYGLSDFLNAKESDIESTITRFVMNLFFMYLYDVSSLEEFQKITIDSKLGKEVYENYKNFYKMFTLFLILFYQGIRQYPDEKSFYKDYESQLQYLNLSYKKKSSTNGIVFESKAKKVDSLLNNESNDPDNYKHQEEEEQDEAKQLNIMADLLKRLAN